MHRPSSSSSDAGAAAGGSTSTARRPPARQRPTLTPGGPRKPTTKPTSPPQPARVVPSLPPAQVPQQAPTAQVQNSTDGQLDSRRQSGPPPYVDPVHKNNAQGATPQTPTVSEAPSSRPSTGVFSIREDSFVASPVQTTSPTHGLESHPEEAAESQKFPTVDDADATPQPEASASARVSASSIAPSVQSAVPSLHAEYRPRLSGQSAASRTTTPAPPPAALPPPPSLDFTSEPVAWKPLTLEAAQWTFSSEELQAIVSRAIRASAEPASIRLLSLQVLDHELTEETTRLEAERASTQAQYRFAMHRRTMLLQSLNALSYVSNTQPSATSTSASTSPSSASFPDAPSLPPTSDLAHRLSEITANLDRLALTLLRTTDQLAQLRSLQDVHASSALAVALRKLNASYARRTKDIQTLRERFDQLEAERDEAWRVAEELAREVDENVDDDDFEDLAEEEVVNGERAIVETATFKRASRIGIKLRIPGVGLRLRTSPSPNSATKPLLPSGSPSTSGLIDGEAPDDAVGPTSAPALADGESPEGLNGMSAATVPCQRRRAHSAASRVSAARTRSIRSSKANLRLPRNAHARSPSQYSAHSGRSRPASLSRADSVHSVSGTGLPGASRSPMDDSALPPSTGPGAPISSMIPEVPKMPDAAELARMESVKSGDRGHSPRMPPPLPPPIETSVQKSGSGSFLDFSTRPNSAVENSTRLKSSRQMSVSKRAASDDATAGLSAEGLGSGEQAQQSESGPAAEIQTTEQDKIATDEMTDTSDANIDGSTAEGAGEALLKSQLQCEEQYATADGYEKAARRSKAASEHIGEYGHGISPASPAAASRSASTSRSEGGANVPRPLSLSRGEQHPAALFARMRPPPDSPRDVAHGSGPHSAEIDLDGDVEGVADPSVESRVESRGRSGSGADYDDEARDEFADEFASVYARTEQPYASYRSPLRAQHAQSMLPFSTSTSSTSLNSMSAGGSGGLGTRPGSTGASPQPLPPGAMAPRTNVLPPLPLSPVTLQGQSFADGQPGPTSGRRPTSLPVTSPVQEQLTKPWMYF